MSDYVEELEEEKKILEEYISNLQKKSEEWKRAWESAEKRCGELERSLKSQRALHDLEVEELELKKRANWKLKLVLSRNDKEKQTINLDIDASEKWADNILEAIVFGFEKKGFSVGGGIVRVFDE